ncbi:hypothetical protein ZIOFF_041763 [Zingiber officinale]|uniref:Protein kinase domain-containing protein n=1 Tax=Zingiber officinale TaxID=94328 RepID=A0A8J5KZ24_ZINOF|nr:hypothetical protein ZIOFF_041763 [Zingiber officinale]
MAERMARGKAEGTVAIGSFWFASGLAIQIRASLLALSIPTTVTSALYVLFGSLNSAPQLLGWKQSGDPCGESWQGITCSGSSVTAIKLSCLGLSGTLGYNMNQMASLEELCPSNGNPVCRDLSNNQFGGSIPYSVSHMAKLELLDLSYNSLNGTLPQNFRSLTSLTNLYLENNQFTGTINVLANLSLQSLNVANNHFNGSIPNRLRGINNLSETDNNDWSSGTDSSSQPNQSPSAQNSNTGHGSGVRVGGIAGGVAGVFFIDSFSEDNLIREGTFGHVFKAEFDDRKILAVKKLNPKSLLSKSTGDFIDLVTNISLLHHTNLTELVGYCSEYGQRMLVYDFHKNGSLYELLHLSDEPLSLNARIKIALGAARALE